jgi:hypothetical protein
VCQQLSQTINRRVALLVKKTLLVPTNLKQQSKFYEFTKYRIQWPPTPYSVMDSALVLP